MSDTAELDARERAAHALLASHLEGDVAAQPYVQTVEYDPEIPRWYVRFGCDGRDATTIYFDLHQRTLRYEVYFLPDPPRNQLELYRFLLERNHNLYGARFSIGPDGDLYLTGQRRARASRHRRARPGHRRPVRDRRNLVPTRGAARVRSLTFPDASEPEERSGPPHFPERGAFLHLGPAAPNTCRCWGRRLSRQPREDTTPNSMSPAQGLPIT